MNKLFAYLGIHLHNAVSWIDLLYDTVFAIGDDLHKLNWPQAISIRSYNM